MATHQRIKPSPSSQVANVPSRPDWLSRQQSNKMERVQLEDGHVRTDTRGPSARASSHTESGGGLNYSTVDRTTTAQVPIPLPSCSRDLGTQVACCGCHFIKTRNIAIGCDCCRDTRGGVCAMKPGSRNGQGQIGALCLIHLSHQVRQYKASLALVISSTSPTRL